LRGALSHFLSLAPHPTVHRAVARPPILVSLQLLVPLPPTPPPARCAPHAVPKTARTVAHFVDISCTPSPRCSPDSLPVVYPPQPSPFETLTPPLCRIYRPEPSVSPLWAAMNPRIFAPTSLRNPSAGHTALVILMHLGTEFASMRLPPLFLASASFGLQ